MPRLIPPRFHIRLLLSWQRLIEPHASIREPERRRRSQLLSSLLIFSMLAVILVSISLPEETAPLLKQERDLAIQTMLATFILLVIAYGLSRTRHYTPAAALTVSIGSVSALVMAVVYKSPGQLATLIAGVLLSSLFLSLRATVFVFAATVGAMLVSPAVVPTLRTPDQSPLWFVIVLGTFLMLATAIRQKDLEQIEQQSRELELRVAERVAELQSANERLQLELIERKRAEEALAANEKRFRALIENSSDAIALVSADGTTLYASPSVSRVLGYSFAELDGRSVFEWIHPDDLRYAANLFAQLLEKPGAHATGQFRYHHKDGSWRWYEAIATNLLAEPSVQAIVANYRDITERKRAEEEVQREKVLSNSIIENMPAGIAFLDNDFVLRKYNRAYAALIRTYTPFSPEQALGMSYFDFAPGIREQVEEWFTKVRDSGQTETRYGFKLMIKRNGEQATYWDTSIAPVFSSAGNVEGILILTQDITERKRAAEERERLLEQTRAERERSRQLAQQVIAAQEEERQRLSRELHDEAGQALTALKICLGLIQEDLPESAPLRWRASEALELNNATMDRIRLLAQDLRPPALDALGLNLALEGLCREFARRTHLAIDYAGVELPTLPDSVNVTLYRVLQESLTNVAKHARANRVQVALLYKDEAISLRVEDDGQGFDAQAKSKGIGLLGMCERLELLGGRLEIESRLGQGTCLAAQVPWKEVA